MDCSHVCIKQKAMHEGQDLDTALTKASVKYEVRGAVEVTVLKTDFLGGSVR